MATKTKPINNNTISNSELIKAVKSLKEHNIIREDLDISIALNYSKSAVSAYLNNKRKVSHLFMIKFNQHYFPKPIFNGSTNEIIQLLKANNTLLKSIEKKLKQS
jgi:5,10-methylene-tetrahydrofolate dehydrogenase/methenyl tetrahydrofolate cyclohydrolase